MPCYATPCYAMLCDAVLCDSMLCHAVLYYAEVLYDACEHATFSATPLPYCICDYSCCAARYCSMHGLLCSSVGSCVDFMPSELENMLFGSLRLECRLASRRAGRRNAVGKWMVPHKCPVIKIYHDVQSREVGHNRIRLARIECWHN